MRWNVREENPINVYNKMVIPVLRHVNTLKTPSHDDIEDKLLMSKLVRLYKRKRLHFFTTCDEHFLDKYLILLRKGLLNPFYAVVSKFIIRFNFIRGPEKDNVSIILVTDT
jgi:hypothetical protein